MPVTGKENIFAALFKWGVATSQEENFYSKSFVLVLKRVKLYNEELATNFLNSLFDYELFRLGTQWDITDHTGDENQPDITFESDDALAYVEVKVSSEPRKDQLERYRNELNKEGKGRKTALCLLTRLGLAEDWGIRNQQVSWVKVWRHLLETERKLKMEQGDTDVAPEAHFLVQDFRLFLDEKGMGVERVSQKVSRESLHDLRKFLSLILAGCREAKLEGKELELEDEGPTDESWLGWWFKEERKERRYWCGFYLNNPMTVGLGVTEDVYRRLKARMKRKPDLEQKLKKEFHWEDYADKGSGEFFFDLPENFISLPVEQQVKFICDSVSDILKDAIGRKIATT
jgi:hypothetical protein